MKKKTKKRVPKPRDYTVNGFICACCYECVYEIDEKGGLKRIIEASCLIKSKKDIERFEKWYAKAKAWVNDR